MQIQSIKISNFKTFDIKGVEVSVKNLTAFIGENSVGKSNVLEALDLFFNFSSKKIFKDSFHHDNVSEPIKIELSFIGFSEAEKKIFRSHILNNELSITQIIRCKSKIEKIEPKDADESDLLFEESKHGNKLVPHEGYEWLEDNGKLPTKTNIKKWWKTDLIVQGINFKDLFENAEPEPEPRVFYDNLLIFWEQNIEIIPASSITGDEKVLGWKSKLKSNLPRFFFIPAMKNTSDELKVTSTSPLGELVSWFSRSVTNQVKSDFKKESELLVNKYMEKIDKDKNGESKLGRINRGLRACLKILRPFSAD